VPADGQSLRTATIQTARAKRAEATWRVFAGVSALCADFEPQPRRHRQTCPLSCSLCHFCLHANTAGTLSADISNRPLCGGLKQKKSANKTIGFIGVSNWLRGLDLNQRPSGYEPEMTSTIT